MSEEMYLAARICRSEIGKLSRKMKCRLLLSADPTACVKKQTRSDPHSLEKALDHSNPFRGNVLKPRKHNHCNGGRKKEQPHSKVLDQVFNDDREHRQTRY